MSCKEQEEIKHNVNLCFLSSYGQEKGNIFKCFTPLDYVYNIQ